MTTRGRHGVRGALLLAPCLALGCLTPLYELPVEKWLHHDPEELRVDFDAAHERCIRSAVVHASVVEARGNVAAVRTDDMLFLECMHTMGWWLDYEPVPGE